MLEASGGLELPLVAALAAATLPVVIVNPRQVRDFAKATGTLAKTDALVEAAQAAARTKDTYLSARYRRIASRRGRKRAIVALAHKMLKVIYHMLRDGTKYRELGGGYFDQRDKHYVVLRNVRRIERLGYRVALEAA